MRLVRQVGNQDCMAACIASLLDLPLGVVPVFERAKNGEDQLRLSQKWLAKVGYSLLEIPLKRGSTRSVWRAMAVPTPCILGVATGKAWDHAIVGKIDSVGIHALHDPDRDAPESKYKILSVMFLVPAIPPGIALENLRLLRE